MHVTNKFILKLINKNDVQKLKDAQMNCAKVWNHIVEIAQFEWSEHKNWIGKYDIQKILAGVYPVQRHTLNALTDKYQSNRETISKLRRNGNQKAKYPYKEKTFFCIPFKESAIKINGDTIRLTLSVKNYVEIFNTDNIEHTSYAEIVFKNGQYYFHYTKEVDELPESTETTPCGVDIGEVHTIALSTEKESLVISGRAIRSVKQWRNKSLAYISKRLSKCQKSSRNFNKWIRVKNYVKTRSDNQLLDLYHKATRLAVNFCVEKSITDMVIGKLKGVEKNTKKKKRLKRKTRQKISQMAYGKITDFLEYKSKLAGIRTQQKPEHHTSQMCPENPKHKYKPSGRNYNCPTCGCTIHRDVNGAFNIMKKAFKDVTYTGLEVIFKQPVWYKTKVSTN